MAETLEFTADDIISAVIDNCVGFHYSDPKANGRTSHAFLFKNSQAGKTLAERIQRGLLDGSLIYTQKTKANPLLLCYEQLMLLIYSDEQQIQSSGKINLDSNKLFRPLLCATRGSTTGATTTMCSVRGYALKTPAFNTLESACVCDIVRAARRPGAIVRDQTLAHELCKSGVSETVERQCTFFALLNLTGYIHSMAMSKAMYALILAWKNVRASYSDAGRRFRDGVSRKQGYEAYQEALFNVLHSIRKQ